MIKTSAQIILGNASCSGKSMGDSLMDMERGSVAYEALSQARFDNDLLDEMTMTTLGTWIYYNIFIPRHTMVVRCGNLIAQVNDKDLD